MPKSTDFSGALRTWMDIAMHRSMHGWSHHAKASGLSMPQFSILMQLYYRGHCGISDIRDRFEITAAAASQHVENLVRAGLIERSEVQEDRRLKQVQLTPKGRHVIEKGIDERYRWLDQLREHLDDAQRRQIGKALETLADAARKLASD
jgi:MarR family 2-MHQ and catechol resistance regulon transcriptional repressor